MTPPRWLMLACAIWAALVAAGIVHFQVLTPTGDGFTRGMNRATAFVAWEFAAMLWGFGIFFYRRGHRAGLSPTVRVLSLVPPTLSLAALVFVVAWLVSVFSA